MTAPLDGVTTTPIGGTVKHDYDLEVENLRMQAYYFGFDPTGILLVDRLLSEIATAGKAYHSTEWWNDEDSGDPTHIGRIQGAASEVAAEIRRLRAQSGSEVQ